MSDEKPIRFRVTASGEYEGTPGSDAYEGETDPKRMAAIDASNDWVAMLETLAENDALTMTIEPVAAPSSVREDGRTVYVVETGDYKQRHVSAVASSIDKAVEAIKATYPPPYVVAWQEVEHLANGADARLVGKFEWVPGYSTEHVGEWDISAYEIDEEGVNAA